MTVSELSEGTDKTITAIDYQLIPHTKKIRDSNRDQLEQPTTCNPLQSSSRDQHLHIDRNSTYNRADKKPRHGQEQDRLPTPDIRDLGPYRRTGCVG